MKLERLAAHHQHLTLMGEYVEKRLKTIQKPEQREKLRAVLRQIEGAKANIENKQNEAVSLETLSFRPFKPFRALTLQEQRANMQELNTDYNDQQDELENDLNSYADDEIEKFRQRAERHVKNRDYTAIAALLLFNKSELKGIIRNASDKAYNKGKTMSAKEFGIVRPNTPLEHIKIGNLEADDLATSFVNNVSRAGKDVIKAGIMKNASDEAILKVATDAMKKEAEREIANITGTVIAQNINNGRTLVFRNNLDRISRFQRSEVLDDRTCEMCMTLDGRVLPADDPMVEMDIVHTNCRGVWIPIFTTDETIPEFDSIPNSIREKFDLVDGRPIINRFRQLKKVSKVK